MPDLKDILKDKATYQDNLAWTLGNGVTVTLGQLRTLSAAEQSSLSAKEAELETTRTDLTKQNAELKKAQTNTAQLYTTVTAAVEAIRAGRLDDPSIKALGITTAAVNNNQNDPFAALARLEGDSLMGPVVQVIKAVREEAIKAQTTSASVIEIQKKMAESYLNDQLEERYDRLVPADKQDKITLETLIQTAVRNNYYNRSNVPDLKKAYRDLTAADTAAAHDAEVADKAVKDFQAKQAAASGGGGGTDPIFVPRGTNFGLDVHNRSGAAPKAYKDLDEAFAAAAKDKDIWAAVDSITN